VYSLGEQACRHPVLDVKAKEIMKFMQPPDPIACAKTEDWVVVTGNVAKITDNAKRLHGVVTCDFYGTKHDLFIYGFQNILFKIFRYNS